MQGTAEFFCQNKCLNNNKLNMNPGYLKQDHRRMNVAPDQTIILGLYVDWDGRVCIGMVWLS